MNRLERLYAITEEVRRRAPRPVSAAVLAERFDVTRRTVERDLAALRGAGVPLAAVWGQGGGQVLEVPVRQLLVTLSDEEVTALLVAAAAAGSTPFGTAGRAATQRLLDALPATTRPLRVDLLRAKIRATLPEAPRVSARVRTTLEEAVRREVVVRLRYRDRNGTCTDRAVDAVGFYGGPDGWYLIGWCHLRAGGRIFRLDRIERAQQTRSPITHTDVDDTLGWVPGTVVTPA